MAQPKYCYFNVRARGELPRLIAALGGIKYEDHRMKASDWPGELKAKTPFGQVPVLTVGGKTYGQKLAISLYFARQCGLYPKSGSDLELLSHDHLLQFTEEILENLVLAFADKKFNNKPESVDKCFAETLPPKLTKLDGFVKANGTGFLVGNKVSINDLSAFDVLEHVMDVGGEKYFSHYPNLLALYKKVKEIPAIKNYIANRPKPEEGFDF